MLPVCVLQMHLQCSSDGRPHAASCNASGGSLQHHPRFRKVALDVTSSPCHPQMSGGLREQMGGSDDLMVVLAVMVAVVVAMAIVVVTW